jgi:uncharacterized protein YndB with AHSA1/START domain
MIALAERLDRTLIIRARPEIVFRFLTDSPRWAEWWGTGSTIDARPGGLMRIRHPNGAEVAGEVLRVDAPECIAFTYGYVSGAPIPPGGSRVTIRLDPHPQGTLLQLTHEFADPKARDEFVQGWRFQLSLFANVIANAASAEAAALVDGWFSTWSEPDTATREASLARVAAADIQFQDKFSCVTGLDDVRAHLAAVHRFMPGLRLERRGEIRHCQWHVLVDWAAVANDGQERGRGTNLFEIDADLRVAKVTGFWAA